MGSTEVLKARITALREGALEMHRRDEPMYGEPFPRTRQRFLGSSRLASSGSSAVPGRGGSTRAAPSRPARLDEALRGRGGGVYLARTLSGAGFCIEAPANRFMNRASCG